MSSGCSPTDSRAAFYIQNCSRDDLLEVRRNVSRIKSRRPCGSVQFLLISWRHRRLTEKGGGTCVKRPLTPTTTRRQFLVAPSRRHTLTSVPASGQCCHVCTGSIYASEFTLQSHLRCHRPSLASYHVQRHRRSRRHQQAGELFQSRNIN